MSDVLHRTHLTPTELGMVGRRMRFLADINDKAAALQIKPIPIQCVVQKPVPVPVLVFDMRTPADLAFGPIVHREPRRLTVEEIIRATAKHFHMSKIEILSDRRTAEVVYPRHIAMYLSKKLTMKSLPYIGLKFGGRDHTTVLSAVRKMAAGISNNDMNVIADTEAVMDDLALSPNA